MNGLMLISYSDDYDEEYEIDEYDYYTDNEYSDESDSDEDEFNEEIKSIDLRGIHFWHTAKYTRLSIKMHRGKRTYNIYDHINSAHDNIIQAYEKYISAKTPYQIHKDNFFYKTSIKYKFV
jgi:hypothetical protein